MSLAILTEKGRKHAQEQIDAANIVFYRSSSKFHHTNTQKEAFIDGFITKDGIVEGLAEIKARDMTLDQLRLNYRNEWLITASKIDWLKSASILFCVPGYGILYLVPDQMCLMVKICDESGALCCDYYREETETQATCNGGTATRVNAFIKMDNAKAYRK